MTRHEKCGNCRFVEISKPGDITYAECHKAAPIPSPEDSSSWWPMKDVDSPEAWCGEWAESDEEIEKRRARDLERHQRCYSTRPAPIVDTQRCAEVFMGGLLICTALRGHKGSCWENLRGQTPWAT